MIIAANLKTNLTRVQTLEYVNKLEAFLTANNSSQEVLVFPATSSLNTHAGKVIVGAQNAYPTTNGAFTGETGVEQLNEFGIKTILIGHSERRHVLGETQQFIAQKFDFYKQLGFKIVYCVGEPLEIRKSGEANMMEYINAQYVGIDVHYENLIIAYEPVWAIGTGLTPTLEDIESLHAKLKEKSTAPLLYGGSVKLSNIEEVLALKSVDGVLVGGASLIVEDFSQMTAIAQNLQK